MTKLTIMNELTNIFYGRKPICEIEPELFFGNDETKVLFAEAENLNQALIDMENQLSSVYPKYEISVLICSDDVPLIEIKAILDKITEKLNYPNVNWGSYLKIEGETDKIIIAYKYKKIDVDYDELARICNEPVDKIKESQETIVEAAANGFAEAAWMMGTLIRASKKNDKLAMFWFDKAVELGDSLSAAELSEMYYEKKEYEKALDYIDMVLIPGYDRAIQIRDAILEKRV